MKGEKQRRNEMVNQDPIIQPLTPGVGEYEYMVEKAKRLSREIMERKAKKQ